MEPNTPAKPFNIAERTFAFGVAIIAFCQRLELKSGVGRTLTKQLLRSGTSIGANVEEGQAGQSKPDFINKNSIALKEARETHYWLRLMAESNLVERSIVQPLIQESMELCHILGAIVARTKERSQ